MSQYNQLHAIVLKERAFNDYDRLVVVYSEEFGKCTLLAKGIRKSQSRMAGKVQPFSELCIDVVQGRGLPVLTGAELLAFHDGIRHEYGRTLAALYMLDVYDQICEEGERDTALFSHLTCSLKELSYLSLSLWHMRFEWILFSLIGYGPPFSFEDHKKIETVWIYQDGHMEAGSAFHRPEHARIFLLTEDIVFLKHLRTKDQRLLSSLRVSSKSAQRIRLYFSLLLSLVLPDGIKSRQSFLDVLNEEEEKNSYT